MLEARFVTTEQGTGIVHCEPRVLSISMSEGKNELAHHFSIVFFAFLIFLLQWDLL